MPTHRLQLTLLPEVRRRAQALPPDVRAESIERMARMLLRLVRAESVGVARRESHDESR